MLWKFDSELCLQVWTVNPGIELREGSDGNSTGGHGRAKKKKTGVHCAAATGLAIGEVDWAGGLGAWGASA